MSGPGYWRNETTGVLHAVVEAYLQGETLNTEQVAVMRAYLRQWIGSPVWDQNPYGDAGEGDILDALRLRIDGLQTHADIERWLADADDTGLDPL